MLITSENERFVQEGAASVGIDRVLVKPLDPQELSACLKSLVRPLELAKRSSRPADTRVVEDGAVLNVSVYPLGTDETTGTEYFVHLARPEG